MRIIKPVELKAPKGYEPIIIGWWCPECLAYYNKCSQCKINRNIRQQPVFIIQKKVKPMKNRRPWIEWRNKNVT